MTTFTATRGEANFPVYKPGTPGEKAVAYGAIEVSTAPVAADIYRMCKLPKGAVVLGGKFMSERLASGTSLGSTSLGWNVGFSGAVSAYDGTSIGSTTTSLALGTLGPIDYAAVTAGSIKPESGASIPLGGLLYTQGPLKTQTEQWVQLTCSTAPNSSFITGTMSLEVEYVVA